jgi:N6-L-threonylcarbamoyladenine synthase
MNAQTAPAILAIETSCDETAAAVVGVDRSVRSSVVASQIDLHARFGGVVPEIASRAHVETVNATVAHALEEAEIEPGDLAAVAVTQGPGLIGALLVGMTAAKTYAFAWNKPIVYVDHIEAHIWANFVDGEEAPLPAVCLVVSGGHTTLYWMDERRQLSVIGETIDDAVGEAYDKVARLLGLPYPGGPHVDRLAQAARNPVRFPVPLAESPGFDFSLSGLKTAVAYYVREYEGRGFEPADVAAGFQQAVVDMLVLKLKRAIRHFQPKSVLAAGGVIANSAIRAALTNLSAQVGLPLRFPHLSLCTDNAVMVGVRAADLFLAGQTGSFDAPAYSITRTRVST